MLLPARGLAADSAKPALAETLRVLLEKARPQSRVLVIDPVSRATRADFTLPAGTVRARMNAKSVQAGLVELRRAFLETPARAPWEAGALCLPQTLPHLRTQVLAPGTDAIVLCFGDPLHRAREDAFTWIDGEVPTTGWLFGDTDSPFSSLSLGSLQGLRVHIAAVPPEFGVDDWQRAGVREFLAAMISEVNGRLVSLADAKTVMSRAISGVTEGLPFAPINRSDPARLYRRKIFVRGEVREERFEASRERKLHEAVSSLTPPTPPPATVVETLAVDAERNSATTVSEQVTQLSTPPQSPAIVIVAPPAEMVAVASRVLPTVGPRKLGFGLIWEPIRGSEMAGIDLDLRASIEGIAAECYFNNKQVPKRDPIMLLYSDVTTARGLNASGDEKRVFEFLEITQPIALNRLTLHVNCYNNREAQPIRALLRVQVDGKTYDELLEFPAMEGSRGRGNRDNSPEWKRIDVAAIVERHAMLSAGLQ